MAIIKINTTEFYYEIHGDGHPMVIISGIKGDHRNWLPVLNELKTQYKILIFDNRGVGRTKYNQEKFSIDNLANYVIELMDKVGFNTPYIVGHSMGGAIAQSITYHYPDKVK